MRWIIRVIGAIGVVAVLGVGAVIAVVALPSERIAGLAADRLGAALGREVTLAGDVRPTLWPHLGVRAEGVRVAGPDWAGEAPLLAAEALSVRLPWAAVLGGAEAVQIDEIALVAPEITLVRGADGRESWAGAGAGEGSDGGPAGGGAGGLSIGVSVAEITRGTLRLVDLGGGPELRIDDLEARVSLPVAGPATVEGTALVNGTALSLSANVAAARALAAGGSSAVEASLAWAGGTTGLNGTLGGEAPFAGALVLEATDLGPVAAILGAAMPDLPRGYGRDRVALAAGVAVTPAGAVVLSDARLTLDDTTLAMALEITQGAERPLLRGAVSGARLAVPGAGPAGRAGGRGGAGAGASAGWSRAPIDVSGLFAVDADIALAVDRIEAAGLVLGPVDLRLRLDAGRLVIDLGRAAAYGGVLAGEFVVNGRGGLSVRSDAILADVDLSALLSALAGYDRLEGRGSVSLQALGVGNDVASLMGSMQGTGDFALGAGAIRGLDLAGMIRTMDAGYRGEGARTVYDRVAASFTIAGGVLSNDDLRLDAPWGDVTGAGTVNLGARTLDYRLIPQVLRGAEGSGIRVPILVSGSWASPSIRPDLEFLAEQELADQRDRLEAEARARLDAEAARLEQQARERIDEALGLSPEGAATGDDAREELEQRLRDAAADQLLRLLRPD